MKRKIADPWQKPNKDLAIASQVRLVWELWMGGRNFERVYMIIAWRSFPAVLSDPPRNHKKRVRAVEHGMKNNNVASCGYIRREKNILINVQLLACLWQVKVEFTEVISWSHKADLSIAMKSWKILSSTHYRMYVGWFWNNSGTNRTKTSCSNTFNKKGEKSSYHLFPLFT